MNSEVGMRKSENRKGIMNAEVGKRKEDYEAGSGARHRPLGRDYGAARCGIREKGIEMVDREDY